MSFAIAAEPPAILRERLKSRFASRFAIVPRRDEGAESDVALADV